MNHNDAQDQRTVLIDADNTLWDTDEVFAAAQVNLLAAVEAACGLEAIADDRLAFVREVDQSIAEQHHLGLRYPPRMLVAALTHLVTGVTPDQSIQRAIRQATPTSANTAAQIEANYGRDLARLPNLLAGVREGLSRLQAMRSLILIVTESASERVRDVAKGHGLAALIDRVIEAPKTHRFYERMGRLQQLPRPTFMVGDQLGRDIGPANDTGLVTVYIPGRFRPRWEARNSHVEPAISATNFADAVTAILSYGRSAAVRS